MAYGIGSPQRQSIGPSHRASCSRGIVPRDVEGLTAGQKVRDRIQAHTIRSGHRFSRHVLVRDDSRHTHLPPASEPPCLGPRPRPHTHSLLGELGTAHPSGHALDLCPPKRLSPSFYHARFASLMPRPTEPLAHFPHTRSLVRHTGDQKVSRGCRVEHGGARKD